MTELTQEWWDDLVATKIHNNEVACADDLYDLAGECEALWEEVLRLRKAIAMLSKKAEHARSMVTKYRMDDREFREWSARAAGLEDAADLAREIAENRDPEPSARTGS